MTYFKNLEKAHTKETAGRLYYSIMQRDPKSKKWGPQWGSFDKNEVKQEMIDMKESGEGAKSKDLVIVGTIPGEAAIKVAVTDLNKNCADGVKGNAIRWYVGEKSVI